MRSLSRKRIALLAICSLLVTNVLFNNISHAHAAAELGYVMVRYDRMIASTATNVVVLLRPSSGNLSPNKIKVKFGSATVGASPTISTTNLPTQPASISALPGTLSIVRDGGDTTQIIVTGFTVPLSSSTTYGFNIATGITTAAAGFALDIVHTTTVGDVDLDYSRIQTKYIANDTIVITAVVPPIFDFTLSGNTDAFTADLNPAAIVSTTGVTETIKSNGKRGFYSYLKSANAALSSAYSGDTIATVGAYTDGAPTDMTTKIGQNGYVLDVTKTAGANGTCTSSTVDPEYWGAGSTTKGGALDSSLYRPIGYCVGTTDGTIFTLKARATISYVTTPSNDYTDSWYVTAAGHY